MTSEDRSVIVLSETFPLTLVPNKLVTENCYRDPAHQMHRKNTRLTVLWENSVGEMELRTIWTYR